MKLLIFEYITGGGMQDQPLPASLLAEGRLMLQALLQDCLHTDGLAIQLLLDHRCLDLIHTHGMDVTLVYSDIPVLGLFRFSLTQVDAVWIIAPEFDDILTQLSQWVEASGKLLLGCSAAAVALCTDKWLTYQCLKAAGIDTVATALLSEVTKYQVGEWVIKPRKGVACLDTWRITKQDDFVDTLKQIPDPSDFIIQPYITGQAASLSCLFQDGAARLLSVNIQDILEQDRGFQLRACRVNSLPRLKAYQALLDQIARCLPGLFGYVGIDFILPLDGVSPYLLLEINPRLCSSYVGMREALGFNLVQQLCSHRSLDDLVFDKNESVLVALTS